MKFKAIISIPLEIEAPTEGGANSSLKLAVNSLEAAFKTVQIVLPSGVVKIGVNGKLRDAPKPLAEALNSGGEKLEEAKFYYGELHKLLNTRQLDVLSRFKYSLSSFVSAGRSVALILEEAVGRKAIDRQTKTWTPDEQATYRAFTQTRNRSIHHGEYLAEKDTQWVEMWELPFNPEQGHDGGYAILTQLPGTPSPRFAKYDFKIGGLNVPALNACKQYLVLLQRLLGVAW